VTPGFTIEAAVPALAVNTQTFEAAGGAFQKLYLHFIVVARGRQLQRYSDVQRASFALWTFKGHYSINLEFNWSIESVRPLFLSRE
jgi:hypothetical protein